MKQPACPPVNKTCKCCDTWLCRCRIKSGW